MTIARLSSSSPSDRQWLPLVEEEGTGIISRLSKEGRRCWRGGSGASSWQGEAKQERASHCPQESYCVACRSDALCIKPFWSVSSTFRLPEWDKRTQMELLVLMKYYILSFICPASERLLLSFRKCWICFWHVKVSVGTLHLARKFLICAPSSNFRRSRPNCLNNR